MMISLFFYHSWTSYNCEIDLLQMSTNLLIRYFVVRLFILPCQGIKPRVSSIVCKTWKVAKWLMICIIICEVGQGQKVNPIILTHGNCLYIKIIVIMFDLPFWFVHLFEANWLRKYYQFKPFRNVDMNWNPWCLMASHGTYICCLKNNCNPFICHGLGGWDKLHHLCQLIDHNKNGVIGDLW